MFFRAILIFTCCGIVHPANKDTIDKKLNFLHMSGNEVFKIAVNTLAKDVVDILEKNSVSSKDIDLFIPHQANLAFYR